jgi:autotransporter-associated beta strand protein
MLLMTAIPLQAQQVFWNNATFDHDFANAGNWDGGAYPAGAEAVIQNDGYADVKSAAEDIYKIYVGAVQGEGSPVMGTGVLNVLDGGDLTATSSAYLADGDGNEGTVNVYAGGKLASGSFCVGYGENSTATLNVDGGEYVCNVYFYPGYGDNSVGKVNLTAGSISIPDSTRAVRMGRSAGSKGVINQSGGTFENAGIVVMGYGADSTSVINLSGGYFDSTGTLYMGDEANTAAIINQTGGDFHSFGREYLGSNDGAYGYHHLAGGTITVDGIAPGASNGAIGVFEQEAGTSITVVKPEANAYGIRVGTSGGGLGVLNQKGGTIDCKRVLWAGGNYANTWGQVEIGGTITVSPEEYTAVSRNAASKGYVNLNTGGVLTTPVVRFYGVAEDGGEGIFTFHGGALKANAGTADPADPTTHFMRLEGEAADAGRIFIGAEGGIIDTDGYDVVISEPLRALTGMGLPNIPLLNSGDGYEGAPVVQITGGSGKGATAVANVAGGKVTDITVTNPGSGYQSSDSLTISLVGGGASSDATIGFFSLAANPTDGGLCKTGLGALTLAGDNTYVGLTDVQMGTLKLTGSLVGDVQVAADAGLAGGGGSIGGDVDLNGALEVEYNSDDDTIDLLAVVGELDVTDATFSFSDVGAGTLAEGDYVFATYGLLVGNPATPVGLHSGWSIDYAYGGANSIALIVSQGTDVPGDANGDGSVNEIDAQALAANWGKTNASWADGDFNKDGRVNVADAAILAANWGTGPGEATATPEPSVLAGLLLGLASLALFRRRS